MQRFNGFLNSFVEGGYWAASQSEETRRNLRWFWMDGLFASASDSIPLTFFTLYLLALGASGAQVGLLSSLTNLSAAIFLLPGALMVERFGHRKELTFWIGGIIARFLLIVLALLPLGMTGKILIWTVMAVSIIRSTSGNLIFPAWMSFTADVVPIEGRGRYFASRNIATGAATMLITYLSGEWISRSGSLAAYQIAIIASFVLGMASTFSFYKIRDPRPDHHAAESFSLKSAIADLRASPAFLALCAVAALWNFSLYIAGPFFTVYMAQDLKFDAAMIGMTAIIPSITKLVTQRKAGELADRFGSHNIQAALMFIIPTLPIAWMLVHTYTQVLILQAFAGIMWGGFDLVSFNVLLGMLPQNLQARYSAIYQIIIALAFSGGAVLGSALLSVSGYQGVFLASAIGRIISALIFLLVIKRMTFKEA